MKIQKLSTYKVLSEHAIKLIDKPELKVYIKLDIRRAKSLFFKSLDSLELFLLNLVLSQIFILSSLWYLVVPYIGIWRKEKNND